MIKIIVSNENRDLLQPYIDISDYYLVTCNNSD